MSVSSIYHFFAELVQKRGYFLRFEDLEEFDFPDQMIAIRSRRQFPDIVLKENTDNVLAGGELIEIKSAKTYSISSFNSTIPKGTKRVSSLQQKIVSRLKEMPNFSGLDRARPVFYLIRGMNLKDGPVPLSKVCLVHGNFFESLPVANLMQKAFAQLLEDLGFPQSMPQDQDRLVDQSVVARTRQIPGASVKLRFRVMCEAAPQANLLNSEYYPDIADNSISLIIPMRDASQGQLASKCTLDKLTGFEDVPEIEFLEAAFSAVAPESTPYINLGVIENQISSERFLHAWASFRFDPKYQAISTAVDQSN